jgi:hypothetical protein
MESRKGPLLDKATLAYKYESEVEAGKHSSLLQSGINYSHKKLYIFSSLM